MLKKVIRKIKYLMSKYSNLVINYFLYQKEFIIFKRSNGQRFRVEHKDKYMCLADKSTTTGFDKHYIYHTAWAARKLRDLNPCEHIDISSSLYFVTLVSAFIPVKFFDYRPAIIELENLSTGHVDITKLPFKDNSIDSLSCMHVVEHIGLGRYGDPLDMDGDLQAIDELKRVMSPSGVLLFVIPIGRVAKVMFNAHRIYTYSQIVAYFESFELLEFSLIPDQSNRGIIINATEEEANQQVYGCGCFFFKRRVKDDN